MGYRSAQIYLGGSQPNEQVSGGICSWFVRGVFEGGQALPPGGVTTGVTSRGYHDCLPAGAAAELEHQVRGEQRGVDDRGGDLGGSAAAELEN
jgi:hypothetical protein